MRHRATLLRKEKLDSATRLLVVVTALALGGDVAALDAARTATTERGGEGKLDVRLRLNTHHEGGDVDDLATNTAKKHGDHCFCKKASGKSEPAVRCRKQCPAQSQQYSEPIDYSFLPLQHSEGCPINRKGP